jgi:hypothetical protein
MNGRQTQSIKHKHNQPHSTIQSLAAPKVFCTTAEEWGNTNSSAIRSHPNSSEPDMKVQNKDIETGYVG